MRLTIAAMALLLASSCGVDEPLTQTGGEEEGGGDEVLVPEMVEVRGQALKQTQRIFVNFDGPTIDDCDGYCSDARTNRSWAIGEHFGKSRIDFSSWGNAAQRRYVVDELRATFAPYDVEVVEQRPSAGPYTMLIVSSTSGPNHGVAPLDCDNDNASDIAFVYKVGSTSQEWVARAAAHELGHSFGLSHVTGSGDYMHWDSSGSAFTRSAWDSGRSSMKCYAESTQDAPALLGSALGARGRVQEPACSSVTRLSGATRHETATAVSKSLFPHGASAVVLVRDSNENPDALAAAPLAASKGAPVLLTASDKLPPATSTEIDRLNPNTVYVIGGEAAVSPAIVDGLRRAGRNVVRLAGASRYETAAVVGGEVGASELAIIASGEGAHLVDAVAASGIAAALGAPILLVSHDSVPQATRDALRELGVRRTVVAGGPASVSDAVVATLPSPTRVAGPSRYDTAARLAEWGRTQGVPADNVFIARGDLGPDALAGGAAGRVTVLTPADSLHPASRDFIARHATSVTILGGPGAVSTDVEWAACESL